MTTAVAEPAQPSTATLPAVAAATPPAAPANPAPAGVTSPAAEPAPRQTLLSDIVPATEPAKAGDPAAKTEPAKAEPAKAAEPAVEDYSVLKVPDKSGLTADDVKAVAEFAKAQKISATQAQALIERDAKLMADFRTKETATVQASHDKLYEDWGGAVKADKEFGGDKLPATLSAAKQFLAKYGDPELREFLAKSPFGNHPLLTRMLARAGKAMGEDSTAGQSTPHGEATRDPVSVFYPKMAAKRK